MANPRNTPIPAEELQGVYTALITPMLPGDGLNNPIDYEKLWKLIEDQVKAGVNGFVIAGTTGQSATLDHEEQAYFIQAVFNHIRGNHGNGIQVIPSAGSNRTAEAVRLTQHIEHLIGPSTFLHVTGYYNNPPQEGLKKHFREIARGSPTSNIVMYTVKGRTSSGIEAKTAIDLAGHSQFIGIKVASEKPEYIQEVIDGTRGCGFRVLSGEDDIVADVVKRGGYGVISASANIAPKYFVEIARAGLRGDHEFAMQLQQEVNPIVKKVFCAKNPIPLAIMLGTEVRLPLVTLARLQPEIDEELNKHDPAKLGLDYKDYREMNR